MVPRGVDRAKGRRHRHHLGGHQIPPGHGPSGASATDGVRLRRHLLRILTLVRRLQNRIPPRAPGLVQGRAATAGRLGRRRPHTGLPPEPDDPWVVLAEVDVDGDGRITKIDNCSCRRMIVSLAHLWWRCQNIQPAITGVTTTVGGKTADEYPRGQKDIKVTVKGDNIDEEAAADLGQGVQVTNPVYNPGEGMTLTVAIADTAQPGPRTLTITNPNCAIATYADALTVSSETTPKTTQSPAPKRTEHVERHDERTATRRCQPKPRRR